MPRVYVADAKKEECMVLRATLENLEMEVVGESMDWK
jgi:hypothetical protein